MLNLIYVFVLSKLYLRSILGKLNHLMKIKKNVSERIFKLEENRDFFLRHLLWKPWGKKLFSKDLIIYKCLTTVS